MATDTPPIVAPADPPTSAATADDDPLWYKDAVIYQVHVKAFHDSNNDGIGDFKGLTEKLDYLQALGITCLWLLPFFPSPLRDDGYDIADYRNVHPSYGTLDDFRAFVEAAHQRHIKVLIELVVNHTSDQHPWFQRARQAPPGSPEHEFYVWSDTDKKFPETRIIFLDTEKSNWAFDPVAGQYYWHRFFSHQPDLNHNNPAVVDAVIDVMKFWLDFGVDALRLDAVPYLCVREGTNNENLPETHAVLKRMRREMDASYRNRMLLAEANQWPSDVRAYFGDGDECHMAFHFPLMPRMFMALRQEDRHAITEILNQTPEIGETCQWALFLRNHDELTLEMVTDEERDYMYSVYAADPQMRLNVGIRRRLAPLLENSRRRIELMTSLLFSLPGTPIIYYGDEIGMGDNIYLGDRNGVRTPMQWSSDRNGGFSRADPARLYAPPIMDPVYGYQAINVEAQERYPFSPLNWMKRLVAMRRQHRVLGRGSLEIIYGTNRKVLSFLRRDANETILIVANLSRSVQPAEINLKAFAGLVPVEMGALTEFPVISEHPYFFTLGPYAAYWFTLQQKPAPVTPRASSVPEADAGDRILSTLLVGSDWQTLFEGGTRALIERHALQAFLRCQRWFGAKSRDLRSARFADWGLLRGGGAPIFLTTVRVEYLDATPDTFVVPLATVTGDVAERIVAESPESVLARIAGARKGAIVDAMRVDEACDLLLAIIGSSREIATTLGVVAGAPRAPGVTAEPLPPERKWTRGGGDQSNTIAFVVERYALKLFRRLDDGPNPEFEVGLALAGAGYSRTPAILGAVEYRRPMSDPGTLAVLQAFITHQGSGWDFTIDELRRYYERVTTRARGSELIEPPPDGSQPPPFLAALEQWYLGTAAVLGRRTAELHLALASSSEPAFGAEPIGPEALQALAREMREHAAATLALLEVRLPTLSDMARRLADTLLTKTPQLFERLDAIQQLTDGGQRIRIHGDYHLGQVLRAEEDFFILDFEGEPARPLAARRARSSPLKDVAGMIRSYSYAAYAALLAFAGLSADDFALLEPWADAWQHWASGTFLREYRAALGSTPMLPPAGPASDALLEAFVLDKALYELAYELNNRPDWVLIPLIGLTKLLTTDGASEP